MADIIDLIGEFNPDYFPGMTRAQYEAMCLERISQAQQTLSAQEFAAAYEAERAAIAQQAIAERAYELGYLTEPPASVIARQNLGELVVGTPGSISSTTDTALELAQGNQLTAGNTVYGPTAQGGLGNSSGGSLSTLLKMDVGAVGAAVAPILGVAAGVNLYQNNPEFWTKLSQKLLPFCYPGTTEIPTWTDVVESAINPGTYETHTVIDARIVEAIRQFFEEEGIGQGHSYESSLNTSPVLQPIPTYHGGFTVLWGSESDPRRTIFTAPDSVAWAIYKDNSGPGYTLLAASESNTSLRLEDQSISQGEWHTYSTTNFATNTTTGTYSGKSGYRGSAGFGTAYNAAPALGVDFINGGARVNPAAASLNKTAWTMLFGTVEAYYPEGTSEWQGNQGSTQPYSKQIIYMIEDPNNPGHFIIDPANGVEIALPTNQLVKVPITEDIAKPDNWPEDVPWPMTIAFPWPKPEGYEGDWPETMPWPLPAIKPDWWPEGLDYPNYFPMPVQTNDPDTDPDPNINADPTIILPYIEPTFIGTPDPSDETTPDPIEDPSEDPIPVIPVIVPDPIITPPPPEGETPPPPVIPVIPLPYDDTHPGLITVYHPTDAQLKAFASWLWVTYADPSIQKLWNNPFDGVISLMELYCTPTDVGHKTIRSGFLDSGVDSNFISRYTEINCGSITIPEFYGNYLDYSPYSKCYCYLPFIGIVELNVDDIVGHAVNITYKIDEYNGSCIAQITVAKSTVVGGENVDYSNLAYQFSGNCATELPLAGGTQSAIRAGMMQAAAYGLSSVIGGIVSGVSGNIGGAISQVGYGAANAIGSLVSAKSSVQHSGSFGSSYGAMGVKKPYIIVTRPKQIIVPNYFKLYGFPAHKSVTIGACRGFLRVREVNVKSSTATDDEKKRIEELLKEGVYID